MPTTIGIIRAATTQVLRSTTPHPKAAIRAEDGYTHTMRYAPVGAELSGWGITWEALDRPGRQPIVARTAEGLPALSLEFLLGDPDHQVDVEQSITELRHLAAGGQRITLVNLSPQEAGPWRIQNIAVTATMRQHGTNRITRATVKLDLIEAVDVNTAATVVPRYKRKSPKKAYKYKVKKGDTVKTIAYKAYGDPYAYPFIVKANKLKSTTLKAGTVLTIPKIKV